MLGQILKIVLIKNFFLNLRYDFKQVTLVSWTQPSGLLCLWQCYETTSHFIEPDFDYCLPLKLTNRRLVDLTDVIPAVEDANSKLVDVVVLSDADIQGCWMKSVDEGDSWQLGSS